MNWKFQSLNPNESPIAQILERCSSPRRVRLAIYNLAENRVECATVSPSEVDSMKLLRNVDKVRECANDTFAILAYDIERGEVYLVESVPELPVASAVLLCIVTELMGGCVSHQPTVCKCECEEAEMNDEPWDCECEDETNDEPWKNIPNAETADSVMFRRFRLGTH